MEFFILFGAIVFGIVVGWNARELHAKSTLKKLALTLQEKLEEDEENRIRVSIELHNNHFYVYDTENNKFMAQAGTREELENILVERFPGKKFACSEENLKEVGFLS